MAFVECFSNVPLRISALALVVALTAFSRCAAAAGPAPRTGQPVEFRLTTFNGKTLGPKELKGKIVVISFWTTTDKTAREDAARLLELSERYVDNGVELISVSCDRSLDATKKFVADNDMVWTQSWDGTLSRAKLFGVTSVPMVVLLARDTTLHWIGEPDKLDAVLADAVQKSPYRPADARQLEAGRKALDEARKKLAAKDAAGALSEMAKIPPEASQDKTFNAAAADVRAQVGLAAEDVMEAANLDILQERYLDGARKLRDLAGAMGDTLIGKEARQKLERMLKELPEVKQAFDAEDREAKAAEAATTRHAPASQKSRTDEAAGQKATAALKVARAYAAAGRKDEAVKKYKSIVADFPNTEWSKTAEAEMEKLK